MQENTIKDVKCDVVNCVHNNGDCCCTAQSIKVHCCNCGTGRESICETFEEV